MRHERRRRQLRLLRRSARDIRETVRERYAAAARTVAEQSASPCCCGSIALAEADEPGLRRRRSTTTRRPRAPPTPRSAPRWAAVCPTAVADLHAGETVLDLGSGAGADVLISARRVGPSGKVIGLDMTDEMLALARANAAAAGVENVEFLQGYLEDIPLPDASVDVVISNCVINLAADKRVVLAEAARVLRPGGRFAVSDVIADEGMDDATRADMAAVDRLHRRRPHRGRVPRRARRRRPGRRRDPPDAPRPRARRLGDHPRRQALTSGPLGSAAGCRRGPGTARRSPTGTRARPRRTRRREPSAPRTSCGCRRSRS